jgi:transcriptional regulator with XRE-family HTH domain
MDQEEATRGLAGAPPGSQSEPPDEQLLLAKEFRKARARRGLPLRELARRAGVSASLVSQIETGKTSPSAKTLRRLAAALEIPVASLFLNGRTDDDLRDELNLRSRSTTRGRLVRVDRRRHLFLPESQLRYELLTPDLSGKLEFLYAEVPPNHVGTELLSHVGEEVLVVLEGSLFVWLQDEQYELQVGDALTFDSSIPHRIENPGPKRNVHVSAITPPSF